MNPNPYAKQLPPGYPVQKGYWIVGSLRINIFSVSAHPVQHASESAARTEAQRLASLDPEKKFVVLEVKGVVSIAQHIWE